ncbi:MAG: outer membrane protein-like protein [Bryobacterales bacterium]|nr:outer membrane protein-like protein [Bryobacterales bacterium]
MGLYKFLLIAGLSAALSLAQSQTNPATGQSSKQKGSTQTSADRAQPGSTSPLSAQDRSFIQEAWTGGQSEVEMAKMALERASSGAVKTFAEQLIADHTQANRQLEELARRKGVTLESSAASSKGADNSDLASLNGGEFDRAFIKQMVADHEKTIAKFEMAQQSVSDPDVKNFITMTLPTLRMHLQSAKSLSK